MGKKEKLEKKNKAGGKEGGEDRMTIDILGKTTSLTRSEALSLHAELSRALGIDVAAPPPPFSPEGGCPECGATTGCSHMITGAGS